MHRLNAFLLATSVSLLIAVVSLFHALKQHPPYAPQVNAQQQSDGALKGEQNAKGGAQTTTKANEEHGGKFAEQSENEGTEFWPPFLGFRLKITDSLLAVFTGGLLIFTGLLWRSTDKLWAAGERQFRLTRNIATRQSRQTDETIRLARDEFLSTHRPKLRVKHVFLTSEIWKGAQITVNVVFVNSGTINANIVEWGVKFIIEQKGRMLPARTVIHATKPGRPWELQPGISIDLQDMSDGTVLTDAQNSAIRKGDSMLYCLGYARYFDGASNHRTTAFCRILAVPAVPSSHQDTGRFRVFDDPDYEYED